MHTVPFCAFLHRLERVRDVLTNDPGACCARSRHRTRGRHPLCAARTLRPSPDSYRQFSEKRHSTQSRRRQVGVLRFFRRVGTKLLYLVQGPFLSTTHPSRAFPTPHGPPGADEDTAISPQRRDPLRCRADSGARWRSVDVAGGSRGADSFLCMCSPAAATRDHGGDRPRPCSMSRCASAAEPSSMSLPLEPLKREHDLHGIERDRICTGGIVHG